MRLILGLLAVAHLRWAEMEDARFHLLMDLADEAHDRAREHVRRSHALAGRAGFAPLP